MGITYKDAGVDTKEGERAVSLMKEHVKRTFDKNVLTGLGGFGGLFKLPVKDMKEPVLVSGTDGVGTKLKIAFLMDKHDTVGIDCVAMCINDILCQGATPLFFLDYIATGRVKAENIAQIVKGISEGCLQGSSALIGGETAEMPGFYREGEYDIAGFAVGAVEEDEIVNGSKIEEGDTIIAISSSGPHSNGFSLIRKLFVDLNEVYENKRIWEHLLTPTKIYVKSIRKLMESVKINGMAHITGGGLIENVPRTIPDGFCANIDKKKVEIPSIFKHEYFKKVTEDELWGTFNMGVGFIVIVKKEDAEKTIGILKENGENAYEIGYISKGENKLCLK